MRDWTQNKCDTVWMLALIGLLGISTACGSRGVRPDDLMAVKGSEVDLKRCGKLSFGDFKPGARVLIGEYASLGEEDPVPEGHAERVGQEATISERVGVDMMWCPTVRLDLDHGAGAWRIRDLTLVTPAPKGGDAPDGHRFVCGRKDPELLFGGLEIGEAVYVRETRRASWPGELVGFQGTDVEGCGLVRVKRQDGSMEDVSVKTLVSARRFISDRLQVVPQGCDESHLNYGAIGVGSKVTLGRHRPVGEEANDNWAEDMDAYVGKEATVTELAGADLTECPGVRVDLDGSMFFWRIRDVRVNIDEELAGAVGELNQKVHHDDQRGLKGVSVEGPIPQSFKGYFWLAKDKDWAPRGSILTGIFWDHTEEPMWEVVHGYGDEGALFFGSIADVVYLGSTWNPAFSMLTRLTYADHELNYGRYDHFFNTPEEPRWERVASPWQTCGLGGTAHLERFFHEGQIVELVAHKAVDGQDSWTESMVKLVGSKARFVRFQGVDAVGCPMAVVEAGGGEVPWRVRAMRVPTGNFSTHALERLLQELSDTRAVWNSSQGSPTPPTLFGGFFILDNALGSDLDRGAIVTGHKWSTKGPSEYRLWLGASSDKKAYTIPHSHLIPLNNPDNPQWQPWNDAFFVQYASINPRALQNFTDIVGGLEASGGRPATPQACGQTDDGASFGALRVGSNVLPGRHRPVNDDDNWAPPMAAFIGAPTTITSLAGADIEGCPVVKLQADGGRYSWRVRDLAIFRGRMPKDSAPTPPTPAAGLQAIYDQAGDWATDMNWAGPAPPIFKHYFMVIQGDGYISAGSIVTGSLWDNSSIPRFQTVYGYALDDGDWYAMASRLTYLGDTLTDEHRQLADQLRGREGDDISRMQSFGKVPPAPKDVRDL